MMISVIIPIRASDRLISLPSINSNAEHLRNMNVDTEIIVEVDYNKEGANACRNRGFRRSKGEYILFSDCDISWRVGAFIDLYKTLTESGNERVGYSYGSYQMGDRIYCNKPFDAGLLKEINYISTMSLIKRQAFIDVNGFDEKIQRLQDWDFWLSLLEKGYIGKYCGKMVFFTEPNPDGVSFRGEDDNKKAERIIKEKHENRSV